MALKAAAFLPSFHGEDTAGGAQAGTLRELGGAHPGEVGPQRLSQVRLLVSRTALPEPAGVSLEGLLTSWIGRLAGRLLSRLIMERFSRYSDICLQRAHTHSRTLPDIGGSTTLPRPRGVGPEYF